MPNYTWAERQQFVRDFNRNSAANTKGTFLHWLRTLPQPADLVQIPGTSVNLGSLVRQWTDEPPLDFELGLDLDAEGPHLWADPEAMALSFANSFNAHF